MQQRRKLLMLAAAGALAPLAALAQPQMRRIGFLGAASAAGFASQIAGFRTGLRELGYIENKNIALELRWAEGKLGTLPELAGDLVRLRVDVIVTQGVPATRAAKEATTTIPIVMAAVGDAVIMGIVASLARPGGNVTGSTFFALELFAKRVELLRNAMPHAKRVAVLFNPDNPLQRGPLLEAVRTTAASLKLDIEPVATRTPDELENAIAAMAARGVDAVVFSEEPLQLVNASALTDLAVRNRLATIGPIEFAPAGVLMAYGVDFPELYRRAAVFVDKILKGAKPADLPIEQPTRFELVINLKSARALGLSIPPPLLLRADRVIE